jgi:tRNA-modifying protein YgfZ
LNALSYIDLSDQSLLSFMGQDSGAFLANLLTCDVAAVTPTRSTYGAYCTPQGRMLASFLLWRSEQGYFMQLPSSLREPIQKQLSRYVLRSKVKIEDASGAWSLIGIAGEDATSVVEHLVGPAPHGVRGISHSPDATVIRLPGDRFEIVAARNKAPRILESLASGTEKAGSEYWDWLDIRAGISTITPATQEAFVPQMVNLDLLGGVSFEKGCYPGQEIVARMHYRGTLKQRMYLASIASAEKPQPGDKLYSANFGDQACGSIVNAAQSPYGGFDALAVIQITSAAKGPVRWKSLDGPVLKFQSLPYAPPAAD